MSVVHMYVSFREMSSLVLHTLLLTNYTEAENWSLSPTEKSPGERIILMRKVEKTVQFHIFLNDLFHTTMKFLCSPDELLGLARYLSFYLTWQVLTENQGHRGAWCSRNSVPRKQSLLPPWWESFWLLFYVDACVLKQRDMLLCSTVMGFFS